jgi:zinc protease
VAARLLLDAGSMRDPRGMEGIAQLTADLLDEGTGDHSALELAEAIDALGASFGCNAGPDHSDLIINVLARNFDAAMGLLAEILRRPTFDQRELDRVRQEQLSRILQAQDNPGRQADRQFLSVLYGEHPYGHHVDGLQEAVAAADRDTVLGFYGGHYGPGSATLIVTGSVDPAEAATIVTRHLGDWQGSAPTAAVADPSEGETETTIYLFDKPGAPQSELRVGHLAMPRNDQDWIPAQVLNAILGGKFTSRINLNLREEHGFTYGARSAFDGRRFKGSFSVSSAVNAPSTAAAVREVLKELQRIRQEPVDTAELDDTRSYLNGVFPLKFETARDLVMRLTTLELYDLPRDSFESYTDQVSAVTRDDLLRVAQRLIRPDAARIVVVGPAAAIEAELAAIAPVKRLDRQQRQG